MPKTDPEPPDPQRPESHPLLIPGEGCCNVRNGGELGALKDRGTREQNGVTGQGERRVRSPPRGKGEQIVPLPPN